MKKSILFLAAFCLLSCGDDLVYRVPWAPVRIRINMNIQRDQLLRSPANGKSYTTGERLYEEERMGYAGVFVYHTLNNTSSDMYAAFDLCCPVEANKSAKVSKLAGSDVKLKCSTCGSVYEIGWGAGNPIEGPAKEKGYALQRYAIRIQNDNEFLVIN